jgi:hypothetical protein
LKGDKGKMEAFDMELTKRLIEKYLKSSKKEKSEIISKYCELTKVKRATAVKRFERYKKRYLFQERDTQKNSKKRRGPKKKYESVHEVILWKCWGLSGCVCAEKLHPMLEVYIEELKKNNRFSLYELSKTEEAKKVSLGTLKRMVNRFPKVSTKKHKGNAFIYQKVPISANFGRYAFEEVGYVEVDFVEHNGGSSAGPFAVTAVYTDLYSQWISRAAGLGKNQRSVEKMDLLAHTKLPVDVLHYHPDNDKTILKVLFEKVKGNNEVNLSRSRPYKKNDNAHVEQKNGDKVRKLVGYFRYESEEEVSLLNEIYSKADLLDNFFIASFKLKNKVKNDKGKTVKKEYEKPKTPYQRLLESNTVSEKTKSQLKKTYESLNMVKLREEINLLVDKLYNIQLTKSKSSSKT